MSHLIIQRKGNEWTCETQFPGRTNIPCILVCWPYLPNYQSPEFCPLSFHTGGQVCKGSYRSHVVTLSEEETGSITHLRWPSMRKSSSGRRDALPLLKSTLTRQWYNQGNICQWCSSGRAAWGELCELPALGWECRVWQAEFKNTGRHHGQPRGEQFLGKKAN